MLAMSEPPDNPPRQFDFEGHSVRVVMIDGEPWWVANDVCAALGIVNTRHAVDRLDPGGVVQSDIPTSSGVQRMNVINEPGLYRLIFRSDKPAAESFQRWVYSDVLPTLRKTGGYGREMTRLELAEMVVAAEKERLALAEQLHEAGERVDTLTTHLAMIGPDADAWQQLAAAGGDWLVEEVAKLLNRDPAIDIGPRRLWDRLYEWDLMTRYRERPMPRQQYIDRGLFRTRIASYPDPAGGPTPKTSLQVRVTYEGIVWLHQKLGGTSPVEELLDGSA